MNERYIFEIDFTSDDEDMPPNVFIVDTKTGDRIITLDEMPTSKQGGALTEIRFGIVAWRGGPKPHAVDLDDWEPGSFAKHLLTLLNTHPFD